MISNLVLSRYSLMSLPATVVVFSCSLFSTLLSLTASAQTPKTRYGVWVTPVNRNTRIQGLAVGPLSVTSGKATSLEIDGLNLEILPVSIFTLPGAMFGTMLAVFPGAGAEMEPDSEIHTTIKGINLSGGTFQGAAVNGLSLNMFNSYSTAMSGAELSLFANSHARFTGLMASTLGNRSQTGKGVQIGMFNTCEDGRVFQFGFVNRIGKRVLPIMNFSLGKRKRK